MNPGRLSSFLNPSLKAASSKPVNALASFAARISAGDHDIAALAPSLHDRRYPRQTLRLGAARYRPDATEPGTQPAPGLGEQPSTPQVLVEIDLVIADALLGWFLPAESNTLIHGRSPKARLVRVDSHQLTPKRSLMP